MSRYVLPSTLLHLYNDLRSAFKVRKQQVICCLRHIDSFIQVIIGEIVLLSIKPNVYKVGSKSVLSVLKISDLYSVLKLSGLVLLLWLWEKD